MRWPARPWLLNTRIHARCHLAECEDRRGAIRRLLIAEGSECTRRRIHGSPRTAPGDADRREPASIGEERTARHLHTDSLQAAAGRIALMRRDSAFLTVSQILRTVRTRLNVCSS